MANGRTNIVIDNSLIRRAMRVTGSRTKRATVDKALRDLVERAEAYETLKALRGKLAWNGDLKAWRKSRV